MPNVVYSDRGRKPQEEDKTAILVYVKASSGSDALAWVDSNGTRVSDSQYRILRAAECQPTRQPCRGFQSPRLVEKAVVDLAEEEKTVGGGLGRHPARASVRMNG